MDIIYGLKQMTVVLLIGTTIFHFARPYAIKFSSDADYARRRNVWFAITATAFLSPNFWLFVLIAAPILLWASRRDTNPVALYLILMQVVPSVPVNVPMVGLNGLIELDFYRLLSFCVLIPTALQLRKSHGARHGGGIGTLDVWLLAYGVLRIALYVVPDSLTHTLIPDSPSNVLRRAFLFFLDIYVLYYVTNRSCSSARAIAEVMATFCLSCALLASLGIFESARHWLLYTGISSNWARSSLSDFYSMRNGVLRAQVSTGHPIALGTLLSIGFGFWLYLKSEMTSIRMRIVTTTLLWLGLLATVSRGPWLGAVVIYFAFAALGAAGFSRLFKALAVGSLVFLVVYLSPLGERIVQVLPFMGGAVDADSLLYRQQLFTRSLQLIQDHPFFGDRFLYRDTEDLRQGQGIIDFVNTYAQTALTYGLVGLSLFVGFIGLASLKAYRQAKATEYANLHFAQLGTCLAACIIGMLVMIASFSFGSSAVPIFYVLGGLAAAYARLRPVANGAPPAVL
jgi:O-antigen ligase